MKYKRVPIPGYEGLYDVDTNGIIYSVKTGRPLSTREWGGYLWVAFHVNCNKENKKIHRIVADTFIPKPDPNCWYWINHIDGVKTNNKVDNLEWVTPKENVRHAYATGLITAKTHICACCGKEFKRNYSSEYPQSYCAECKAIYRSQMPTSKGNVERQKQILSKIADLGIPRSEISRVTGKSDYTVSRWVHGWSCWKSSDLDIVERGLLEVQNE